MKKRIRGWKRAKGGLHNWPGVGRVQDDEAIDGRLRSEEGYKGFDDLSKMYTKACWVLASAILVDSRPRLRMCKYIPLSRISVTLSHADLVVVGSARGSDKASSVFVLRWSFRNDAIL